MFSFLKIDFGTTFFFKQMGQKRRVDLRLSGLRDTYRRFLLCGGEVLIGLVVGIPGI